jgi:hypothetical protein
MSRHEYHQTLSEQDSRDYSDMQDHQEADRWQRERHDDMLITAALAGRNQRIREQRAAQLAEQLPATPSRAIGRAKPITGEEYTQRATYLRMNGQEALEELDRIEDTIGRSYA